MLSDSPGLVELLVGLAFLYCSLPDWQAPLVSLFWQIDKFWFKFLEIQVRVEQHVLEFVEKEHSLEVCWNFLGDILLGISVPFNFPYRNWGIVSWTVHFVDIDQFLDFSWTFSSAFYFMKNYSLLISGNFQWYVKQHFLEFVEKRTTLWGILKYLEIFPENFCSF